MVYLLQWSMLDDFTCEVDQVNTNLFEECFKVCAGKEDLGLLVSWLKDFRIVSDQLLNLFVGLPGKFGEKWVKVSRNTSTRVYTTDFKDSSGNLLLSVIKRPQKQLFLCYIISLLSFSLSSNLCL